MRVHHLNCGSMRPPGAKLLDGEPGYFRFAEMVCHVLLVESEAGLVLVDTGFGEADLAGLPGTLPREFVKLVRPVADPSLSAIRQVEALGHKPSDVKHILLTHMDLDHAGGLRDFPGATVHVYGPEHKIATAQASYRDRQRFRPGQWAHQPKWEIYPDADGERWFGFEAVRGLVGLPEDFLLVPLVGHTHGHVGVAVKGDDGWLLHAGDSFFHRSEVDPAEGPMPPLLATFESLMQVDKKSRLANQVRLRELVRDHGSEVRAFSAHDAVSLRRMTAAAV
ncbi:MBL fold metallo-hydrolase [Actinokineospora sp. HUAS TT18]|uniref:MBL fold metallo-hydrolase n=1 Tax=Actinokineospora sp. HUAS TT18 TaxID=3447451 RepID=UPI003F51DAE1